MLIFTLAMLGVNLLYIFLHDSSNAGIGLIDSTIILNSEIW